MTFEELQLIREIEKVISALPKDERMICDAMLEHFRTQIKEKGVPAMLALALVGAEMQAIGEDK
jgi:hypothetical protein